jgi:hypothetical protein
MALQFVVFMVFPWRPLIRVAYVSRRWCGKNDGSEQNLGKHHRERVKLSGLSHW